MGAAVGATVMTLAVYGDWLGLGIFVGLIVIILPSTVNIPLATGVAFFALPFIVWFTSHSVTGTVMAVVLFLLVGGKFLPTALKDWRTKRSKKHFFFRQIKD